jgi:hypothetical protein
VDNGGALAEGVAADRARKARRYFARRTLWRITTATKCRACGRALMDPDTGVVVAQTAEGNAVVLGLMKCGRIWLCPVCSAKIRTVRAEEITRAVVGWIERGGTALLITLTARHGHADRLADLMDAIQGTRADKEKGIKRKPGAYQRLISGAAWAGDARRAGNSEGIRGRVGYIGLIRATEVTVGLENLWHPHIHAIMLVGGVIGPDPETGEPVVVEIFEPDAADLKALKEHVRKVWTGSLEAVNPDYRPSDRCTIPGCACKGEGHGVDLKRLHTAQDARDLGKYIAKTQDGKNPANELARGDLKSARYGNMTPFELLGRIGDLIAGRAEELVPGEGSLTWCLARWHEYEPAVKGRRAIEWSRGLRALLGIEGDDSEQGDLDALFELETSGFRAGVRVEGEAWGAVTSHGLDLEAIDAAEGRDGAEAVGERVTEVVVMAGAPAGAVRVLSPSEVDQAWDAILAALAERREAAAERRRAEKEREDRPRTGEG